MTELIGDSSLVDENFHFHLLGKIVREMSFFKHQIVLLTEKKKERKKLLHHDLNSQVIEVENQK